MGETPDQLSSIVVHGGNFRVLGPITRTEMWLEPRPWWQFWKPRYIEKIRVTEIQPNDRP